MDRNLWWGVRKAVSSLVALRKESVDRNDAMQIVIIVMNASLSARRAWIEIPAGCWRDSRRAVALRKESVDRNFLGRRNSKLTLRSLSARRAWIEIIDYIIDYVNDASLSARRAWIEIACPKKIGCLFRGRSPQGERG